MFSKSAFSKTPSFATSLSSSSKDGKSIFGNSNNFKFDLSKNYFGGSNALQPSISQSSLSSTSGSSSSSPSLSGSGSSTKVITPYHTQITQGSITPYHTQITQGSNKKEEPSLYQDLNDGKNGVNLLTSLGMAWRTADDSLNPNPNGNHWLLGSGNFNKNKAGDVAKQLFKNSLKTPGQTYGRVLAQNLKGAGKGGNLVTNVAFTAVDGVIGASDPKGVNPWLNQQIENQGGQVTFADRFTGAFVNTAKGLDNTGASILAGAACAPSVAGSVVCGVAGGMAYQASPLNTWADKQIDNLTPHIHGGVTVLEKKVKQAVQVNENLNNAIDSKKTKVQTKIIETNNNVQASDAHPVVKKLSNVGAQGLHHLTNVGAHLIKPSNWLPKVPWRI